MKTYNFEQQTEEWYRIKDLFPFSASHAQAIASAGKGLDSLIDEKLASKYNLGERESFTNKHLGRGNEKEDVGIDLYKAETGNIVSSVGFITNSKISELAGVSPDGLVNDDGLAEVKSRNNILFVKLLREFAKNKEIKIPSANMWQMQMQLLFTERKWVDYIVVNDNYSKDVIVQRVYPDPIAFEKLKTGLAIAVSRYKKEEALLLSVISPYQND